MIHDKTEAAAEPEIGPGWLTTTQAGPLLCNQRGRSVLNHIKYGTQLPDGRVVRLKSQFLGRYYTRAEWVTRYLAEVSPPEPTVAKETPDEQRRRMLAAQARFAVLYPDTHQG